MSLITVKTFNNVMDAHMAKAKLELEGVECCLFDEHLASVNPLLMQTIGGVKLKVDDSKLEQAAVILNIGENEPFTDEQNHTITCPKCGSDRLTSGYSYTKDPASILSLIVGFLFVILPIFGTYVYRCKQCKHAFEPKKAGF